VIFFLGNAHHDMKVTYSYLLVRLLGLPGNACAQASPVSGYRAEYAN